MPDSSLPRLERLPGRLQSFLMLHMLRERREILFRASVLLFENRRKDLLNLYKGRRHRRNTGSASSVKRLSTY